jgi:hypothetical protein
MSDVMVIGERYDELVEEILLLDFTFRPGAEMALVHGRAPNEGAADACGLPL